jgi:hypothetical protein
VRRTVSDGDGRALRGRRVRAHLRDCAACNAFATAIPARREQLRMLVPPLVPAASAAILTRILGAQSGPGGGAAAGAGIAGTGAAGKTVGATLAAKALTGAAVLATAAAGVVGVRAVVPSSHHSTRQSISAHRAGTGTAAAIPTRAGQLPPRSVLSTPNRQGASRAAHPASGAPVSSHGSSAGASPNRASTRERSVQSAPAVGLGNAPIPATTRRAPGTPAPSSAVSNSAQRANPARVPRAPSVRQAPRAVAPPSPG